MLWACGTILACTLSACLLSIKLMKGAEFSSCYSDSDMNSFSLYSDIVLSVYWVEYYSSR